MDFVKRNAVPILVGVVIGRFVWPAVQGFIANR